MFEIVRFIVKQLFDFVIALLLLYFIVPSTMKFYRTLETGITVKEALLYCNSFAIRHTIGESRKVNQPASLDRERIVKVTKNYLGQCYVWGATSDSAVDCSGLTYEVYRKNGVKLPRTAAEQYNYGSSISHDELKKGDLVFFSSKFFRVSHVGIYIGKGRFIHANTRTTGVIESSLDNALYKPKFVGAKTFF